MFDGFYGSMGLPCGGLSNAGVMLDRRSFYPSVSPQILIETIYEPKRILKSGKATIVFWKDGTKTVVKCGENDTPDDYDAFTAALSIKLFGSNSKVKKIIRTKTEVQHTKKGDK